MRCRACAKPLKEAIEEAEGYCEPCLASGYAQDDAQLRAEDHEMHSFQEGK